MGISTPDPRFIDLYTEYLTMKQAGDKVTYIVAHLATRYSISERKVYKPVRQFGRDCNVGAV